MFVDLDGASDDELNKLALVEQYLVLFQQLSQKELFPHDVQLLSLPEKLFQYVELRGVFRDFTLAREKHEVRGGHRRLELVLFEDLSVGHLVQLRDLDDKVNTVLHVVLADLRHFSLLRLFLKHRFVLAGPPAQGKLSDL